MVDRPILFSSPMVRALLDGRKTQTRRILKDAPTEPGWLLYYEVNGKRTWVGPNGYPSMPCMLRFAVGDRLWVRETFRGATGYDNIRPAAWGNKPIWYEADGEPDVKLWWHLSTKKRVAIHMPRWASRLTLTVTDVRIQRLQDITEADAIAEGIPAPANSMTIDCETCDPRDDFQALWNSINGADSWAANPWVCAISFEVRRRNIDEGAR